MADYGDMFYGTLPEDTQDFRQVLAGIGRTIRDRALAAGERIGQSGSEAIALQNQIFGDPNRPLRVTDENALRRYTDMIMGGPMGFAPAGITAYHGSPYLFRQFNPAKVGTGEGAQAYGVGSGYTAEARPVAEGYRAALAGREQDIINNAISRVVNLSNKDVTKIKDSLILEGFPKEKITPELQKSIGRIVQGTDPKDGSISSSAIKEYDVLKKLVPESGYLYKGDIPDEILPKFLDWDKPLTKNAPQEVKDAFNSIVQKYPELKEPFFNAFKENKPGSHYYSLLNDYAKTGDLYKNQLFASQVLENAGIRGIRYLDQGSRGKGKGTSNFIPFRPEDYKIQEINDIPLEDYIRQGLL